MYMYTTSTLLLSYLGCSLGLVRVSGTIGSSQLLWEKCVWMASLGVTAFWK